MLAFWGFAIGLLSLLSLLSLAGSSLSLTGCEQAAVETDSTKLAAKAQADRANIVLITIDTLRADHLGCYGYTTARTPNLDSFAASSVRFAMATTVTNNTLPSHLAMLTGKYPHNFGVPRNGYKLPSGEETLAMILKKQGYHTAAFVSASALHSDLGIDRGFDLYDQSFDTREIDQVQRKAQATCDRAVAWLKRRDNKPFFLWVHFFDPHYPYTPPAPYDTMFYPNYQGEANGSIPYVCAIDPDKGFPPVHPTPDDLRKVVSLYDGEIAYLDAQLAPLFEVLNEAKHRQGTLVMLTADHGESLGEHNYHFDHGKYVYQPGMHVPMIVRAPGFTTPPTPQIATHQVETIDLFATALAYVGAELPDGIDGADLRPLLRGENGNPEDVSFGESCRPWEVEKTAKSQWKNINKAQFAMTYPWKLILTPFKKGVELYRLDHDPGELTNLAHQNPEIVERLAHDLRMWRQHGKGKTSEADLDNMEKLRGLGYVGSVTSNGG